MAPDGGQAQRRRPRGGKDQRPGGHLGRERGLGRDRGDVRSQDADNERHDQTTSGEKKGQLIKSIDAALYSGLVVAMGTPPCCHAITWVVEIDRPKLFTAAFLIGATEFWMLRIIKVIIFSLLIKQPQFSLQA